MIMTHQDSVAKQELAGVMAQCWLLKKYMYKS